MLNDLSHELDLACWLTGQWKWVSATGGKVSHLEINSDDVFTLLLVTQQCPVISIQVNYLDRHARRRFIVNTDAFSLEGDLINGWLKKDDQVHHLSVETDTPYMNQHQHLLSTGTKIACTLDEGIQIVKLIEAAKISAAEKRWIKNN